MGLMAEMLGKNLLDFFNLGPDDEAAVGLGRIIIVIILMVILRRIESFYRANLSHNGVREDFRFVQFFLILFGNLPLLLVVIKNHRTVLSSNVISLPVHGCRIVRFPEDLQQLFIAYLRGVIFNLNDFCVSGIPRTDLLVGWLFDYASGVTGGDL